VSGSHALPAAGDPSVGRKGICRCSLLSRLRWTEQPDQAGSPAPVAPKGLALGSWAASHNRHYKCQCQSSAGRRSLGTSCKSLRDTSTILAIRHNNRSQLERALSATQSLASSWPCSPMGRLLRTATRLRVNQLYNTLCDVQTRPSFVFRNRVSFSQRPTLFKWYILVDAWNGHSTPHAEPAARLQTGLILRCQHDGRLLS
jgi:hypothetical protein